MFVQFFFEIGRWDGIRACYVFIHGQFIGVARLKSGKPGFEVACMADLCIAAGGVLDEIYEAWCRFGDFVDFGDDGG